MRRLKNISTLARDLAETFAAFEFTWNSKGPLE